MATRVPAWVGALSLAASTLIPSTMWGQVGAGTPAPEWRWRQILSVPRIGGRLTAVAVDPRDPRRIFVGTQQGTVLRSLDGGYTWTELDVGPVRVIDRSLGLRVPGLPKLGKRTRNNFRVIVDPPWKEFGDRIPIPSVAEPFPIRPHFFFAGFLASSPRGKEKLLSTVTRSRARRLVPVYRIVLCPGGQYPLLVATKREVYGSQDDGLTYVRIFANPGRTTVDHLYCSPDDPDQIAVATGIGLFTSGDGGLTFDQDLSAWPGQRATAVAYGPGQDGGTRLYSASGSELFAGDPYSKRGLQYIYPSGDSSTAPWMTIWWIATNPDGSVWLATDDGARFSPDFGKTWRTAARTLLSRQSIWQVEIGENERGEKRVALMLNVQPTSMKGRKVSALHDSRVYASDDGGRTFHPFFDGLSRRSYRQMAAVTSTEDHPAGWWVVTSGGVWTTYPKQEPPEAQVDLDAIAWAVDRQSRTPPLNVVMDEALQNSHLSNAAVYDLAQRHRAMNYVPRFDLRFEYRDGDRQRALEEAFTRFRAFEAPWNRSGVLFFVQASWDIKDVLRIDEEIAPIRNQLHELRRQIAFAVEDAWHERMTLLAKLEGGIAEPDQVLTIKARIYALESMLAVWMGRPIAEPERPPRRMR